MIDINKIPALQQRQDSASDQLADLAIVANKLGMYDAADVIRRWCKKQPELKYGCHCDLEAYDNIEPDDCVIDSGDYDDCIYAHRGMEKEQCEFWKPFTPKED